MDRISEEIAHFIGLFHLEVEGQRLRLDYDAFAVEREETERQKSETPVLVVGAPYALDGFDPQVAYKSGPAKAGGHAAQPVNSGGPAVEAAGPRSVERIVPEPDAAAPAPLVILQAAAAPFVMLPNSILVSIGQETILRDNDVLLATGEQAFVDPAVLTTQLLNLVSRSEGLGMSGGGAHALPHVPGLDDVEALAASMAAFDPGADAGASQCLLRGEEALGLHQQERVSGHSAEGVPTGGAAPDPDVEDADLPTFFDLLPEWIAEDREAAAADEEAPPDPFAVPDTDVATRQPSEYAVDPGHAVVTGANVVTNEASIVKAWVDAPVIAVAGDAVRLDVVQQINALATAPASFGGVAAMPSKMLNVASIELESAARDDAATGDGVFPETWTVVTVEADLIAVNWVHQYVFATDFDRAEVTIEGSDTYISLGENAISNAVALTELGFHYDLIMVGGDMISLNMVEQMSVLADMDVVEGPAASPVKHVAGDNLQYNRVEIKQTGRDEMTEMSDQFRAALDDMAEGKRDLAREIAEDARFEGKAALKALHIKGDLIKANVMKQHNILGDSDQVQLMLDDLLAQGGVVELVTGSNAQMNSALIHDIGLDSEVMVGGEAYSDALLYQANLLDADAPPSGVGMTPLANEAVAFLADGFLEPGFDHGEGAVHATDHPVSSDVMQTMVS